ncbi:hypothetical protein A2U01_0111515, partial [Trifolium medium]|nr:hypothetical protein [Trifolium medium]
APQVIAARHRSDDFKVNVEEDSMCRGHHVFDKGSNVLLVDFVEACVR